jgi:hypothetical protein
MGKDKEDLLLHNTLVNVDLADPRSRSGEGDGRGDVVVDVACNRYCASGVSFSQNGNRVDTLTSTLTGRLTISQCSSLSFRAFF